jgi:GTP-binding protein Era
METQRKQKLMARAPKATKRSNGSTPRSGFVSLVGRPNVGKSTLTNALVGEKVAITSSKPQTTRHAIRGITNRPAGQLILVDTPGIHRPRTLLGERLNALVQATLGDVDVIGMCFPADEPIGPGDNFINEQLDNFPRAKKIAVVTKTDVASKEQIAERLLQVSELRDWALVMPVSAVSGDQVDLLADELISLLPEGDPPYLDDETTDEDLSKRISELIRESILEGVHDELPHSLAVTLDDIIEREDKDMVDIYANVFVERDSQKGIIIGSGGARLKEIGATSRASIEKLMGRKVFLSIRVKVAKDWQRDPKLLQRLGF